MKTLPPRPPAAFSLVEVALALGVAAFCLVSIFGLLPLGVNTNRISFEQTSAANVASAVIADLRSTTLTISTPDPTSPYYQITVPSTPAGPATMAATLYVRLDGTPSNTVNTNINLTKAPHYRVTVYFTSAGITKNTASGNPGNPNARAARVLVTWPATADSDYQKTPAGYAGSFETFTALVGN